MSTSLVPGLVKSDVWLTPYTDAILKRIRLFELQKRRIEQKWGSLLECAHSYRSMGLHFNAEEKQWVYQEWAPAAQALWLIGDFNAWDEVSHPMHASPEGIWTIKLPADALRHGEKFKVRVLGADGSMLDRIPAWAMYAVQNPQTYDFSAEVWAPDSPYIWKNSFDPQTIDEPFIYEAHTGMAGEEARVHSYREFADTVLPWIKECGYNVIQLMAVQEHPYYGSFGYHVSSFFAPSSRFGTPDDLKYLVDTAHGLGIAVLLDIVHSHAVKNIAEGLNNFDGSHGQYFRAGERGEHPDWDSKCFDYGRDEVIAFLLSNVAWWLEEFRFDGFRFDGVTAMLYTHRGHAVFDNYDAYFNSSVDTYAIVYLQLANELIRNIKPGALSIAEDMSGMPGLCKPVEDGGLGFSHRLAMGIPDFWIKMIKDREDEDWNMGEFWQTLVNRREGEPHIAYAESHDQALVGDKTLAFRLMDAEMYWNMSKDKESIVIDRGIALHKLIRMISLTVGGEGWLNFMGNEFGHPEWIDFPREGNNWSCQYCRRQWSLLHNPELRYEQLAQFDKALVAYARVHHVLGKGYAKLVNIDEDNKVIAYQRGERVFIISWSANRAIENYRLWMPEAGSWKIVLDTDTRKFGGYSRINHDYVYQTDAAQHIGVYLLPRVGMILEKVIS